MGNAEDYQLKLPEITAITDEMLSGPLRIPVDIYIQEAMDLFKWCQADKEPLVAKGLDWKIVDDIPVRAGALREAESRWITQRWPTAHNPIQKINIFLDTRKLSKNQDIRTGQR